MLSLGLTPGPAGSPRPRGRRGQPPPTSPPPPPPRSQPREAPGGGSTRAHRRAGPFCSGLSRQARTSRASSLSALFSVLSLTPRLPLPPSRGTQPCGMPPAHSSPPGPSLWAPWRSLSARDGPWCTGLAVRAPPDEDSALGSTLRGAPFTLLEGSAQNHWLHIPKQPNRSCKAILEMPLRLKNSKAIWR